MTRTLTITGFLVSCFLIAGYFYLKSRDYWVEFILPPGYRGVIQIIEDPHDGIAPNARNYRSIFSYSVPPSGVLRVKSFELFEGYHFEIAKYANGDQLATWTGGNRGPKVKKDDDIIVAWVMGAIVMKNIGPTMWYFVGTGSEIRAAKLKVWDKGN